MVGRTVLLYVVSFSSEMLPTRYGLVEVPGNDLFHEVIDGASRIGTLFQAPRFLHSIHAFGLQFQIKVRGNLLFLVISLN